MWCVFQGLNGIESFYMKSLKLDDHTWHGKAIIYPPGKSQFAPENWLVVRRSFPFGAKKGPIFSGFLLFCFRKGDGLVVKTNTVINNFANIQKLAAS